MLKTNKKLIILGLETLIILGFGIVAFMAVEANAYYNYGDYTVYKDKNGYVRYDPYGKLLSLQSIKPSSVDKLDKKITIAITGSGFTKDSVVRQDGSNRSTTFIDSRHLLVRIYPDEVAKDQAEFFLTVFDRESGEYSNATVFTINDNVVATENARRASNLNNADTANITPENYNNSNQNSASSNYGYNYSSASSASSSKTANEKENNATNGKNSTTKEKENSSDANESYGNLTANTLFGSSGFLPSGIFQWMLAVLLIVIIIALWRYVHRPRYMAAPMKHA